MYPVTVDATEFSDLFDPITRAGHPILDIGPNGTGEVGHLLNALLHDVVDPGFRIAGDLLAAFAGQKQTRANQPQWGRQSAEKRKGRVGDSRGDRSHL